MENIPDSVAPSLIRLPNVESFAQDEIVTLDPMETAVDVVGMNVRRLQVEGSACLVSPQRVPWGITRVGGPISPNPNPNGRVFVIDSGIAPNADLVIDTALSINFAGESNSPAWSDGNGHGTHVAGTIAAVDNQCDVVGVVPGATVVAVRVLGNSGFGAWSGIIAGVDYVAANGKSGDVANMSLGGSAYSLLDNAVIAAAAKGIKFTLAAGNDSTSALLKSPARTEGINVYTVSAMDSTDYYAWFSNYGNPPIDYAAPGVSVESLKYTGGTAIFSGTSMAAPHLAGLLFAGSILTGGFVLGDPDGQADPIAVRAPAPQPPPSKPTKPSPAKPTPSKPTPAKPTPLKPTQKKPTPSKPTTTSSSLFELSLTTDSYGGETGWILSKLDAAGGATIVAQKPAGTYLSNKNYTETVSIVPGGYVFKLTDTYGDGICCGDGPGSYTVKLGGFVVTGGGQFTYEEKTLLVNSCVAR